MPLKRDHLSKAQGNETFAKALDLNSQVNVDWALTALFYAALHYVEAYLATKNIHSPDHRARDSAIQRDQTIKRLFVEYSELKNYSINARYYLSRFSSSDVNTVQPYLNSIKTLINPLL